MTIVVPLRVPVAFMGYSEAMGFGWSLVWQISNSPSLGFVRYEVLAYRTASMEMNEKRKYCHLDSCACIFGR